MVTVGSVGVWPSVRMARRVAASRMSTLAGSLGTCHGRGEEASGRWCVVRRLCDGRGVADRHN